MIYKHGNVWPSIRQALEQKYNIIDWIDVMRESVDILPNKLYERFLPWANKELNHDQRIVIHQKDTEYYYESDSSGFFLQNLYKVFSYLNVSSEYVIFLHTSYDIHDESERLARQYHVPGMQTVYCPYQWCLEPQYVRSLDINTDKIKTAFLCMNGEARSHRMYTLAMMKELEIFDLGATSLWFENKPGSLTKNTTADLSILKNLDLCLTSNLSRINDQLILTREQRTIMLKWVDKLTKHRSSILEGNPNEHDSKYQANFLQLALWNVVTETVGEYPYSYFTEKTWKAVLTKRPFILLGGHHSLNQIKNLGFKTFDRWIDESYDNQKYFAGRCDVALRALSKFCHYDQNQLQNIALEMQDILEYNFDHYLQVFGGTMVENLINNQL